MCPWRKGSCTNVYPFCLHSQHGGVAIFAVSGVEVQIENTQQGVGVGISHLRGNIMLLEEKGGRKKHKTTHIYHHTPSRLLASASHNQKHRETD